MLVGGDTMGIEMLFANPLEKTDEWDYIQENRMRFLNCKCKAFVGYCVQQAGKYSIKGNRIALVRNALDLIGDYKGKLGELAIEDFVKENELTKIVNIPTQYGMDLLHWDVSGKKLPFTVNAQEAKKVLISSLKEYGDRALQAETNRGVDWKGLSHALRVAGQAEEFLTHGYMTFPRPNAKYLLDVKLGNVSFQEVSEKITILLDKVEIAHRNSTLPVESDHDFIDQTILKFYLE